MDYTKFLRDEYCSLEPETSLPHQSNKFFDLSVIEKCKPRSQFGIDELGKSLNGSPVKCILIEGAPGCGKSTLVREVCQRWGNGTLFQKFSLVLLLKLRDRSIQKVSSLSSCINHHDSEVQTAVFQSIAQVNGKSTVLILDGYDELPLELQASSIFASLLEGDLLPYSTIVVTTRSSSSEIIYQKIKSSKFYHFEVLGFTQAVIDRYIKDGLNNKKLSQDITGHLQKYPYVNDLMYSPLNCAIIVYTFKSSAKKHSHPNTLTGLYTALIKTLLIQYLSTHPVLDKHRLSLSAFSDLPSEVYKPFTELCRMAYEGALHNQHVFSGVSVHNTLGLMKAFRQTVNDFVFLHLNVQEFLAAVHISSFSQQELITSFKSLMRQRHLINVWQFLAGLTNFKHQQAANNTFLNAITEPFKVREFLPSTSLAVTRERDTATLLEILQWLFEAQEKELLSLILGRDSHDLDASWKLLSPFDCCVLGYCIAQSECAWILNLKSCGITVKGIKRIAVERLHTVKILDLSCNSIGTDGGVTLCEYCDTAYYSCT